ncbi:hypothetical protein pb186bvf_007921 [Paramecium bursaria]
MSKLLNLFQSFFNFNIILQMSRQKTRSRSSSGQPPVAKLIRKASKDSDSSSSERRYNKLWSPHEDQMLLNLYEKHNGQWKQIALELQTRNPSQCQQRWKRINPNRTKLRKQWSEEEDQEVVRLVTLHGRNWKLIECEMQGRTGKQIRERFLNNLDPEINKEKFTEQEDLTILQQYRIFGPKWSEISKMLERRPENQVKNRFYSYIKRVYLLQEKSDDDDDDQSDESEEQQQQKQEIPHIIFNHLETIQSVGDNTKNDSLLYNKTPSSRINQQSMPFIMGMDYSFDQHMEDAEISPFNNPHIQGRKLYEYSPINCEQQLQPNFDFIQEDIKDLKIQIEGMYLEKNE